MLIEQAANLILDSNYAVALTGAGISTPSGIPDFRSNEGGLWQEYDPMQVASLSVFRIQPQKFYEWFRPLTKKIINAEPNAAHIALANLENQGVLKSIITQNIDGLHQKSGSKFVLEVHGTMKTLSCVLCYTQYPVSEFSGPFITQGIIPQCPKCQGILKPDAILFEEQLPRKTWLKVEEEIKKCDLLLVAGSSLEVFPVARLPYQAVSQGAKLIIINKQETYIDSRADVVLHEDVAEALPGISEILNNVRSV
jgi:NAD-dependent deacetylase